MPVPPLGDAIETVGMLMSCSDLFSHPLDFLSW